MELLMQIRELQDRYKKLVDSRRCTKFNICELVSPFRDKYGLSDLNALKIARQEVSISEIVRILNHEV